MANKKYNEFTAGIYDTAKIFLQADDITGALEKINLPFIPDGSLLVPYANATSNVALGAFNLQSPKIIGGIGVDDVLNLQGTSGIGTLTSPAIKMLVGSNGASNAITILNNARVGLGNAYIGSTIPFFALDVNSTDNNGSIMSRGKISEGSNIKGVQIGYGPSGDSPRFWLGNGTSSQNWQIDNLAGRMRFFTPANTVMELRTSAPQNKLGIYGGVNIGKNYAPSGYTPTNGLLVEGKIAVGFDTSAASALLHLAPGTASPGSAPLKFTNGALLTAIEAGAMEWDGTNLYISQSGVRKQLAYEPAANQKFGDGDTIATSQRFFDCDNFPFILSADSNISETGFYINYTGIPKTLYLLSDGGSDVKTSLFLDTTGIAMQAISSGNDTNIEMTNTNIAIHASDGANSNRLNITASEIKILKNNAALADYADNAAAITAGLSVGALYRTTDFVKQVH